MKALFLTALLLLADHLRAVRWFAMLQRELAKL